MIIFSFCSRKIFFGLVKMTFGLVDVGYSLPDGQAVKLIFFAPCTYSLSTTTSAALPISMSLWAPTIVSLCSCLLHATTTIAKILYNTTLTLRNIPSQLRPKVGHDTSIKTKFLTISATLCNNHTNNFIITLFFLRFLLRSTKLARPKQMLKSQFSVGPFADSVCVVSSWASQKLLSLCNSPSIKLNQFHVHCFTEQTTVIWHVSKLM